jgi:acyl-CoA synthetase (AMP-forming)/AMP-acid ligase II/acyl carrier protein
MSVSPREAGATPWSTVADILRSRAETRPQQIAYRFLLDGEAESAELTYAELDRRARALAAELQSRQPVGERALLLYPPGLDFVVAFFACAYAGLVAVPAHPPRPRRADPRARQILVDSRARLALTTGDVLPQAREVIAGSDELPDVSWLASDGVASGAAEAWRRPSLSADDLMLLQYTSGSTSTPKGVMVSHANMLANFRDVDAVGVHDERSVILSWLPHLHDMGLIYGILQTPFNGCTCVLMSPTAFLQRPARWLEAITRFRATHSAGPNFAYELCVQRIQPEQRIGLDLSSWRIAWNGAEPVRAETLRRFAEAFRSCGFSIAAFRPSYGLAEATLLGTAKAKRDEPLLCPVSASDDSPEARRIVGLSECDDGEACVVSCGHAIEGTRIAIVEPRTRVECPEGTVGEVWIAGPTVARGYWGRAKDTKETFAAHIAGTDGPDFLRTGDLGFLNDGELFITGRLKDLIIIRGVNHYPHDIELTVERSHPGLRAHASAAFAVEAGHEDRLVVVQEVERVHRNPDIEAITAAIRREILEEHGIQPLAIVLVRHGSVPKTTSGKIQRYLCRDGFLDGTLRTLGEWRETGASREPPPEAETAKEAAEAPVEATVDDLRSWLVARIAARSGSEPADIEVDLPFSDFGLDSLQAQELIGELEQWLGRRLSPVLIWNYPSIEALAVRLAEETQHDGPASDTGQKRSGT